MMHVRTTGLNPDGAHPHLLDAYIYQEIRTDLVRCLALSSAGGVYEGVLTVLPDGALEFDLKGYEGDRTRSLVARFDFGHDGTLRQRVWSVDGTERILMLDVHHTPIEESRSSSVARRGCV